MPSAAPEHLPVVYLLSGLLCDETVWSHQIGALSATHDVRARDFRDFDDIGAMAQSVLQEAPARFALVGHSLGGRVALEIVRRAPERVERLALLDTGVHPTRQSEFATRQLLVDLAYAEGMGALAQRWLPPMVHPDRLTDAALMDQLTAMVMRMTPESHERQIRALLNRPDAETGLGDIACPVLLGVGEQDAWSPPAQHEAMATRIRDAHLVVFPHSGHMSPCEAPEAVTAALRAWLAQPVTGTGSERNTSSTGSMNSAAIL